MEHIEKIQDKKGKIFSINSSKEKGTSKKPVKKAILIEDFGLEQDAHSGPGLRQVSILAIESIKKQLECPKIKEKNIVLGPGDFAENITTEGLNLAQLDIGTKIKVGRDVMLEISKIGKECHRYCAVYQKVGSCIMPKEGIFARVLKGGEISVGDEMDVCAHISNRFTFVVLTISDRCSRGETKDESGKIIIDTVSTINGKNIQYEIIPDEIEMIKEKLLFYCDELKTDIVFTTGGTGLGPRDITPEATMAVAQKIIPGISEMLRLEGAKKTKNAVLSRAISALRGKTLIINLPGSPKGVEESLSVILDILQHALDMISGKGHGG